MGRDALRARFYGDYVLVSLTRCIAPMDAEGFVKFDTGFPAAQSSNAGAKHFLRFASHALRHGICSVQRQRIVLNSTL